MEELDLLFVSVFCVGSDMWSDMAVDLLDL